MPMLPPTILLIDDDVAWSETVIDTLASEGYAAEHAATWEDGVELFRVGGHELVIADYDLRDSKNGLRLLVTLKRLRPSTRLVLISGALPVEGQQLAAHAPTVDLFLVKRTTIIDDLKPELESAVERAGRNADWTKVASAYLAQGVDNDQLTRIDQELRDQVDRG